jgi:hypothetical protein
MPITPDEAPQTGETPDTETYEIPPPSRSFSDMVRESPIGAVIGAFVAGFLISKFL